MDLGTTIKRIRKEKNMTQESFAEKCEITQTYLSQIENNQKEPALATLKKISDVFDIPLPILFYLSLSKDDISPEKRDAFGMLEPSIKSLVHEFFLV